MYRWMMDLFKNGGPLEGIAAAIHNICNVYSRIFW